MKRVQAFIMRLQLPARVDSRICRQHAPGADRGITAAASTDPPATAIATKPAPAQQIEPLNSA
ncbi:hypothetical protein [Saccharopolyspora sp. NPDC050642]|uniref:hypothetical protein n=1 Tax=Saccharopolyspora sp. NPDC050642 TaxID=3157099 RepID=UPI0034058010